MQLVTCEHCKRQMPAPEIHALPQGWEQWMGDDYCPECVKRFQTMIDSARREMTFNEKTLKLITKALIFGATYCEKYEDHHDPEIMDEVWRDAKEMRELHQHIMEVLEPSVHDPLTS